MNLVFVESNTTGSGMLAFAKARALGGTPVLATADPSRYSGLAETGVRVLACDTNEGDLAKVLRDQLGEIAGVTTTSEFYVTTVARTAGELGLPGNPPDAVAACRDKGRMRRVLAAERLPSPAFEVITPDGDLERQVQATLARIAMPCVVKPVDDTGSLDVVLCTTSQEVLAHCRKLLGSTVNVRGQRSSGTALVEGYLNGPEFSVEMLSHGGVHRCVGIVAKRVTPPPSFVECRHVFPAPLDDDAARTLSQTACRALSALGVTDGVTHVEMKLIDRRGYVVEVNARPAGGMIPQVIGISCGFDLVDAHLRGALGLPPPALPEVFRPAGIAFLLAHDPPPDAVLAEIGGVESALALEHVDAVTVTAAPGSAVRHARSSYDRLGHVIAHAPDHARLHGTLDAALDLLRPVLRQPMGVR